MSRQCVIIANRICPFSGILLYNSSAAEGTYTVGNYYTLSGQTTIFSGLYELKNTTTVTALSNAERISLIGTPTTYVVVGGEDDATLANRKTSLTGVVTARTAAAAGSDDTVTVSLNSKTVSMFIKGSGNTSEVYQAVSNSLTNGTPITVEGFTGWHSGFQVSFANLVTADTNYHAADFARDLLKLTMGTCNSSYDGVTDNKSTLTGIWTTLAGADYWLKVEANGEAAEFVGADADSTIVVPTTSADIDAMSDADALAAAAYRYDYCTAKYNLTNFASRSLSVSFARINLIVDKTKSNLVVITIIASAITAITAVGAILILRKRKYSK